MSKLLEYGEIAAFWMLMSGCVAGHGWLLSIGLRAAGF